MVTFILINLPIYGVKIEPAQVLAMLLLFQMATYLVSANMLFANDEGSFLTRGWLISRGREPFKDFDSPLYLPGVQLIAASFFFAFGPELHSAKMALAASGALTTLLVYLISRRLYGEMEGLTASAAFVLLAPFFGSLFFMAENFQMPLSLLLFYALHSYDKDDKERPKWLFVSGLVCSAFFIIKLSGGLLLLAALAYIVLRRLARLGTTGTMIGESLILLSGFLLPLAAMATALSTRGEASEAFRQVFIFALFIWKETLIHPLADVLPYLVIVFIPAASIPSALRDWKKGRREGVLLLLLTLATLYAIVMRFEPQRVIPALPLACVILGPLAKGYLQTRPLRIAVSILVPVLMLLTLAPLVFVLKNQEPSPELDYIASHTSENDRIVALPFGLSMYFLSKREPGIRYIGLGPWGQFEETEANAISDIKERQPKVILYSKIPQWGQNFSEYEPRLDKYIWENYKMDGETESAYFLVPK